MPQLLGLALLGAGVFAGYRAARRLADRMRADLDRAAATAAEHRDRQIKDRGALEFDPASGVYRPRPDRS